MRILICEDDEALRSGLVANLGEEGWEVEGAPDGHQTLERVAGADLLVSDLRLPDMDGLDVLAEARKIKPSLEVIMMTAYGSIPSAVEAMRRGARAYLSKPFDPDELILHAKEAERTLKLRAASLAGGRGDLAGVSSAMRRVYADIDAAAGASTPVLITGETGTGKDAAARAVHEGSRVASGPFIAVNLGALPRELVESELFGHEKGAFTGAHARKKGRFELARGGTLFLDEIDSLPLELQPKLLRAIETAEIWPLGAEKAMKAEVRIVAATNARIEELVAKGTFRKDLYYRLNVLRIEMPSLSERPEDVPVISRVLLDRIARKENFPAEIGLAPDALSALMTRIWSGNVRELANVLERGLSRLMAAHGGFAAPDGARRAVARIEASHLDPTAAPRLEMPFREAKAKAVEEWTRSVIEAALVESNGSATRAAKKLAMGRTALLRLVAKYGIRK